MHTVGSVEEARRAVGCGVDIVVAQGWEAGGHVWSGVATLPLVPAVVDAVAPVPVIAAGGIGDARGVAAVFALGAQAAMLGTRFLLADEMPIHEDYRRRLIAATETDAEWYPNLYAVGWPDASHRAIHNSTAEIWEAAGRPALVVDRERAKCSRTSLPANRSFDMNPRRRWLERPVRSNRYRCGPDRASRSPNGHSPRRKSWPNSSRAYSPRESYSSHRHNCPRSTTGITTNRISASGDRTVDVRDLAEDLGIHSGSSAGVLAGQ